MNKKKTSTFSNKLVSLLRNKDFRELIDKYDPGSDENKDYEDLKEKLKINIKITLIIKTGIMK